ncbi:MAG: hypothetical protein M3Q81_04705 [bacterium]|nr:hypothetical protein [bacterium]
MPVAWVLEQLTKAGGNPSDLDTAVKLVAAAHGRAGHELPSSSDGTDPANAVARAQITRILIVAVSESVDHTRKNFHKYIREALRL